MARPRLDPRRLAFRIAWAVHRVLFRLSGGRLGTTPSTGGRRGTLFLETVGRRSGEPRRTGLYYVMHGDDFIVVASNAGSEQDPAWWLNLQSHPEAFVEVVGERRRVRARRADDAEVERLWPVLTAAYDGWDAYRRRLDRPLPVVVLEPLASGP